MPRGSLNHNWGVAEQNIPIMTGGIPEERQRLLNRLRGQDENNNNMEDLSRLNRQQRRERGVQTVRINADTIPSNVGNLSSLSINTDLTFSQENINRAVQELSSWTINPTFDYPSSWGLASPAQKQNKYIKPYNYVPKEFKKHKLEDDIDNQYFGVELEIDNGGEDDDKARQIIEFIGEDSIYIKHDGSLQNGFEIVTQPCSYNFHINKIDYKPLFKILTNLKYKSHDTSTCGLHIHINKDYFHTNKTYQDLNISKLLFLFEKYWDKLVVFSRRKNESINKWAKRYEMNNEESMFDVLSKAKNAEVAYNGKYHSINLRHKNTVEFRIFRGTLKYETFVASLQLVKRFAEISKKLSIEEVQLITWGDIFKDCEPELRQYLKDKKLEK